MSEQPENSAEAILARPLTETHPHVAKAAGEAVLRAVADLDPESQLAVLWWAAAEVQKRVRKGQPTQPCRGAFSQPHAVTLGRHDVELEAWQSEGLTQAAMAARLGCSRTVVAMRTRTLRRIALRSKA